MDESLIDKTTKKQSNFCQPKFNPHWFRFPLLILIILQTGIGIVCLGVFTCLYRSLETNFHFSMLEICLTALFFISGVFVGSPGIFLFRKYFSLTTCLRIIFVCHTGGCILFLFISTSIVFIIIGQFIIGFCICFYSHHQSEFCLHWFPSKTRRMVGSMMSVFVYGSLGITSILPLICIGPYPSKHQMQLFLRIICIITSVLSFLLLISFREKPPYGYGLLPIREQKPQEILDSTQNNLLTMNNLESINPVPPLSPRTSHLTPLPDLSKYNLLTLLWGYSCKLLNQKHFCLLVLIYAFNNSSLILLCVFINFLTGYTKFSAFLGGINIFIITVSGMCSTLMHSLYKLSFFYYAILLSVAFFSYGMMMYFLYLKYL